MITIFFDSKSKIPKYEQLYRHIKQAIEQNELKADEKLPSKRKLAQHLKLSVVTVETAYNQLIAEGYIKSIPKSGFYVLPYVMLNPISKKQYELSKPLRKLKSSYRVDFKTNKVDVINFPYEKLAKIEREVMLDSYPNMINTSDYLGLYSLRENISKVLFEYRGIETNPESIVIGSGSEHLISLIVLLLGRENIFGVEEPGYLKNYHLYHDYGAKAKTISLDDQGIDIKDIGNANVVHVTPSHQFPSGKVTTISRRMELLNWAMGKKDRYIIEDDYDSEFRFSGIPIPAMKSLDKLDQVIYMNSFSKSLSPSFRVSFMVLPDKLMKKYHESYPYFTCSVPVQTQLVLKEFIEKKEYEKHLNRMKIIYRNKRDLLIDLLQSSRFNEHIEIIGEESGLHFLLKLKTNNRVNVFIESAKKRGIRLYGIHEYCLEKSSDINEKMLVLGYSHLKVRDMKFAIKELEIAWEKLF
ncbi:MAG: hypothetical protein B6I17_03375 [Tenericutes bacterium 4572_104]|nr:MAG: hypothetical protein B6I17_03375 [Tenericutes bacterium 4572_104]